MSEFMLPERISGEYELLFRIDSDSSDKSYIIYDKVCQRKAVLKTGKTDRIENEARILSKFSGNGIPQVYSCFELDGISYLIREYIEGKSLQMYLETEGSFSASETIDIGISVCDTLSRFHRADPPVIHRDIKTENIIISQNGDIYIIDFGISREYDISASRDTCVMGTLSAAPPEQFGYGQTDERSDVYSIGVMLKEISGAYAMPDMPKIPSSLASVIERCVEFSPEKRYQNAAEIKRALLKIKKGIYGKIISATAAVCFGALVLCSFSYFKTGAQTADLPAENENIFVSESYYQQTEDAEEFTENTDTDIYEFADSTIEKEVCRILGKEQGEITLNDLKRISEIKLIGSISEFNWEDMIIHGNNIGTDIYSTISEYGQVSTLDDLAYMTNMHTVILCNQNISDVSPLEGLSITRLALHGNNISDIYPLRNCRMLEQLYISSNPIVDLSPLSNLKRLHRINLGATNIIKLDDISEIPGIKDLELFDCFYLNDISALEKMKNIQYLSLRPVSLNDIDEISKLTNITRLHVWFDESIGDPKALSGLNDLVYLLMDGGGLVSLEGIEAFPELQELQVRYNSITDFSPVSKCKKIRFLALTDNPVTDWSFLSELEHLEMIFCDESQKPGIVDALGDRADSIEIVLQ